MERDARNYVRIVRSSQDIVEFMVYIFGKWDSSYVIVPEDGKFKVYQDRENRYTKQIVTSLVGCRNKERKAERYALDAARDSVANLSGVRGWFNWSRRRKVYIKD